MRCPLFINQEAEQPPSSDIQPVSQLQLQHLTLIVSSSQAKSAGHQDVWTDLQAKIEDPSYLFTCVLRISILINHIHALNICFNHFTRTVICFTCAELKLANRTETQTSKPQTYKPQQTAGTPTHASPHATFKFLLLLHRSGSGQAFS